MLNKKNIVGALLLLGGGFVAYKMFFADDEDAETSESIDLIEEAIEDLRRDEALEEVEPEDSELDGMLEDIHYY